MYTLWNPEPDAEDVLVTLTYGDGQIYRLPLTLEAHATAMVDIGELIRTQQSDQDGKILPANVKQGSMVVSAPANEPEDAINVVVGVGIYNPTKATCGGGCMTCNGVVSPFFTPGTWAYSVGDTQQLQLGYYDNLGYQYNVSGGSNWSSSASQVIGVQSNGQGSPGLSAAISGGSSNINASYLYQVNVGVGQMCTQGSPPVCPQTYINAGGSGTVCTLTVNSPANGQVFSLSSGYNSATIPLNASSNCSGTSVTWTFVYSYTRGDGFTYSTGGGITTTSTLGQTTNWQSPAGVGGQGAITVSAQAGPRVLTAVLQGYIDGTSIPDSVITSQLVSLYGSGATPHLLTGIAMSESSYQQFVTRSLYVTYGPWPYESGGNGGQYVGLMMVPNGMGVAFDWVQNAQAGVTIFQQWLSYVQGIVSNQRASCPGVPALTGQQLEDDALSYYVGTGLPYYIPNSGCTAWITNPGNAGGVAYAKNVRSLIK